MIRLDQLPGVLTLAILLTSFGCTNQKDPPIAPTSAPIVTIAVPLEKMVTDYEEFTGRTDAVESVEVRARVTGYLNKIAFKPGSEVMAGDLLFEIDPRQYKADLDKAAAQVEVSDALLKKANRDYDRQRPLVLRGALSQEEFDKTIAARDEAGANLKAAQATVERLKLNLDWTRVTAPISGVVGRDLVTVGNLVTADTTLLTTIVSMNPIYAYLDVDEGTLLKVQQRVREGKVRSAKKESDVPIFLGLSNEEGFPHKGRIDFVNNQLNSSTGTLRVRGKFENDNLQLSPGLFCKLKVVVNEPRQALLVSERAIGTDQGQKFVFVVNESNEATYRPVRVGSLQQGLRVIEDGLVAGEKVIVNGLQRVRPGATVDPKLVDMASLIGMKQS